MNNNIGLIIWGCKGGHRVFCSNNVVDYNESAIKDTIKDIRTFVRFNQNKLNVYALEFTSKYKIFTLYRSCNDSGTGAYVAITIYVPHMMRISNIRAVLFKMMDSYFDEYIHPLYNTYISGKYDDIKPFNALLTDSALIEKEPNNEDFHISVQDDTPQIRLYSELNEVDGFFLQPYRKEFFACQEVMFMSMEMYGRIPEALQFQRPPKLIESVSDPVPLPELIVDRRYWGLIKSININNVPTSVESKIQVSDYDEIDIVLSKEYYKDYSLKGTVENLKSKGCLQQIGYNLVVAINKIEIEAERYTFNFTLNGAAISSNNIAVSSNPNLGFSLLKNPCCEIAGNNISKPLYWGIKPLLGADIIASNVPLDLCKALDNEARINLESKEYSYFVKVGDVKDSDMYVIIGRKCKFRIPIKKNSNSKISFELPIDYAQEPITFQCGLGSICNCTDDIIEIEPKENDYYLKIANFNIEECDWYLVIDGKKMYPSHNKISLQSREELKNAQLIINSFKFDFSERNNEIIPHGYIVCSGLMRTSVSVSFNYKIYDILNWQIFPNVPEIDWSLYEVNTESVDECRVFKLKKKNVVTGYYGGSFSQNDQNPKKLQVRFINCKGFSFNNNTISSKEENRTISKDTKIYSKDKDCVIYSDAEKYKQDVQADQRNKENGFFVKYSIDGSECTVEYKNKGIVLSDILDRKSIIGLLVIVGLVLGVYKLWPKSEVIAVSCTYIIESKGIPGIEKIRSVNIPDSLKHLALSKDSTGLKIDILFNDEYLKDKGLEDYIISIGEIPVIFIWEGGYSESHELAEFDDIRKAFFKFWEKKEPQSIHVKLEPIVAKEAAKFASVKIDSLNSAHNYYSKAKNIYEECKILKEYLSDLCWEQVDTVDSQSVNDYLRCLDKSKLQEKHYEEASKLNSQFEDKKKEEQRVASLKREIENITNTKIKLLHSDNCNKQIVDDVENWYKGLSNERKNYCNIMKYVDAYKIFFTASHKDDMQKLIEKKYQNYFSKYQLNAIKRGYCKNTESFNTLSSQPRLFSTPYNLGMIK